MVYTVIWLHSGKDRHAGGFPVPRTYVPVAVLRHQSMLWLPIPIRSVQKLARWINEKEVALTVREWLDLLRVGQQLHWKALLKFLDSFLDVALNEHYGDVHHLMDLVKLARAKPRFFGYDRVQFLLCELQRHPQYQQFHNARACLSKIGYLE